jgi:P27 family predicted phage terminase small subunit
VPRQRKDLEIHRLQGTVAQWADTPNTFASGRPKMPPNLSSDAEVEWRRITKELRKRGTLTRVDASALEVYCEMYARWRACLKDIQAHGPVIESTWIDAEGEVHTKRIENPASKIAGRLENSLRAYQKEFSITPSSREKTKPTAVPAPKNPPPQPGSVEWLAAQQIDVPEPRPTEESEVPIDIEEINLEGIE